MNRIYWNNEKQTPVNATLDSILYAIRRKNGESLLFDPLTVREIIDSSDGAIILDALATPYSKLELRMATLQRVMNQHSTGGIKPIKFTISEPYILRNEANVAVVFELSDGQTVSIFFRNSDPMNPKKIVPAEELLSWRWLLNKKDITVEVAPERGRGLDLKQVSTDIIKLASLNSTAFARKNKNRAENVAKLEAVNLENVQLEAQLQQLQKDLELAQFEHDGKQVESESVTGSKTIGKITLLWSEASEEENKEFNSFNELQLFMRSEYQPDGYGLPSSGGYDKHKIKFNEYIEAKIDVSSSSVYFNPFKDNLSKYLKEFGYDVEIEPDLPSAIQGLQPEIELTGKELGDFDDTKEGKDALRSSAMAFFEKNLLGNKVFNVALNNFVEFDNTGMKKVKSFSSDPRKLKLVNSLKDIVKNGKPTENSPEQPHEKAKSKGVKLAHILKTSVKLDEKILRVRFIVHEKTDGHFFYDHAVDRSEFNAAMGGISVAIDSTDAENLNRIVLPPSEPSQGQRRNSTVTETTGKFNDDFVFDNVSDGMIFNLFIEGEESEIIEPTEITQPESINNENSPTIESQQESSFNTPDNLEKLVEKFDKDLGKYTLQDHFVNFMNGSKNVIQEGLHTEDEVKQKFLKKYELNSVDDIANFDELRAKKHQEQQANADANKQETAKIIADAITKYGKEIIMENLNDVFVGNKSNVDAAINGQKSFTDSQLEEFNRDLPKEPQNATADIDAELESLKSETDYKVFDKRLDDLAEKIESAGLMDKYEPKLNELADVLTELLKTVNSTLDSVVIKTDLDKEIHENSATSPLSDIDNPTKKEAINGDYEKAEIKINGLKIEIENPYGSIRKGTDKNGKSWECELKDSYGEISNTIGKDGDPIDVFIRPNLTQNEADKIDKVFIVEQIDPATGLFDEHKVIMGYPDKESAKNAYLSNYEKNWKGLGNIIEISISDFKLWIKDSLPKGGSK